MIMTAKKKIEEPIAEEADVIDLAIERRKHWRVGAERSSPKLKTDDETLCVIRELAVIQCTQAEAASVLGLHRVAFCNWLNRTPLARQAWDEGLEEGKMSLRRRQYRSAMAGNVVMLIWLGKNVLGQKDIVTQDVNMKVTDGNAVADLFEKIDSMAVPEDARPN